MSFLLQLQFYFASLLRLPVAICFCPPLLRCCCWNEVPDRRLSYCHEALDKLPWSFFALTDSVKWSRNSFPKKFSSLVCSNCTLFFNRFFSSWIECTLDRMLHLDGTKLNYLFDQVNKWFVLKNLESHLEMNF